MKKIANFIILLFIICILVFIPTIETSEEPIIKVQASYDFDDINLINQLNIEANNIEYSSSSDKEFNNFIFFGDSRFVGMESVSSDDIFVAEVGQGYDYFILHLDEVLSYYTDDSIIVIDFGINDLYNIDKYIEKVNELAKNYNICYLTVYPVDEILSCNFGYTVTNDKINEFNEKLKEEVDENVLILDINHFININGFNSSDGIHYDLDTYQLIYDYVKNNL